MPAKQAEKETNVQKCLFLRRFQRSSGRIFKKGGGLVLAATTFLALSALSGEAMAKQWVVDKPGDSTNLSDPASAGCTFRKVFNNIDNYGIPGAPFYQDCQPVPGGDDDPIEHTVTFQVPMVTLVDSARITNGRIVSVFGDKISKTTLNGNNVTNMFVQMASNSSVYFYNMRFANGRTSGAGGAIRITAGNLGIVDSIFEDNLATQGGALDASGSDTEVEIRKSKFLRNRASSDAGSGGTHAGGAIHTSAARTYIVGDLLMGDLDGKVDKKGFALFEKNLAEEGGGGAIACAGGDPAYQLRIVKGYFEDNVAWAKSGLHETDGGGALNVACGLDLNNSFFWGNMAVGDGSAISVASNGHALAIHRSHFLANQQISGKKDPANGNVARIFAGTVALRGQIAKIYQNTFKRNQTGGPGGAIAILAPSVNSTIVNNTFKQNETRELYAKAPYSFSAGWGSLVDYGQEYGRVGASIFMEGAEVAEVYHNTFYDNIGDSDVYVGDAINQLATAITVGNNIFDTTAISTGIVVPPCHTNVQNANEVRYISNAEWSGVQSVTCNGPGAQFVNMGLNTYSSLFLYPDYVGQEAYLPANYVVGGDPQICSIPGLQVLLEVDQAGNLRDLPFCPLGSITY